jgi:hypothetical protein
MVRPSATFGSAAGAAARVDWWTAWRRPIFVAFVLGCMVSLLTSGTLTLRLVASATSYWAAVPAIEVLAFAVVMAIGRHRRRVPLPAAIDLFFAGHGPWTLLLLGLGASLSFLPPNLGWMLLLRLWVWATLAILAWSAYIDFCFFRNGLGQSSPAAVRDVLLLRVLTWTAIVALFAWPSMSGDGVAETVSEILR